MAELLLTQVFQQIQCAIPGHEQYKVSRICISKECMESNLVCDLCDKNHKTHRHNLLTVAGVQEAFLELKNSNKSDENFKRLSKMVDDFESFSIQKLKFLVFELKQLLDVTKLIENSLEKNTQRTYQELQNQVTQLLNYVELNDDHEIEFKILKPSDIHPKIHDKLAKFVQEISNFWKKNTGYAEQQKTQQEIPLQKKLQQQPNRISVVEKNQEFKFQNIQQELDNIAKTPLQAQIQNTKIPLQEQLNNYLFSQENCSQQIKCISPKCIQKSAINIANDVACLNKPLGFHSKQSFVFKINRLRGYIGIGIAIFWQVETNNFMFGPLDELGHGIFMVLNNGLVYNNSDFKYNKSTGSIEMREGNKYRLTFDPQNKGKEFCLEPLSQNAAPYYMPMEIDFGLDYHVFVYMGQKDGEVELLNE